MYVYYSYYSIKLLTLLYLVLVKWNLYTHQQLEENHKDIPSLSSKMVEVSLWECTNTDKSITDFAYSSMEYALDKGWPLYMRYVLVVLYMLMSG